MSWQIKLLELRRDVGLRFLERAFQESHITINNLIQAVNARLDSSDFDEYIDKNYEALFEFLILSIFPYSIDINLFVLSELLALK